MPTDTPEGVARRCEHYGASIERVDGLIDECGRLSAEYGAATGAFNVSTLKEPYRIEGKKTMMLEIVEELGWEGPVHLISAAAGVGCEELVYALMNALEDRRRLEEEDPEYAAGQRELRSRLEQEARERVQEIKQENRRRRDRAGPSSA